MAFDLMIAGSLRRCATSLAQCARSRYITPTLSRRTISSLLRSPLERHTQRPSVSLGPFQGYQRWQTGAATAQATYTSQDGAGEAATGAITKFSDLGAQGMVSPVLIDTITKSLGFQTMSEVQSATISEALKGVDM